MRSPVAKHMSTFNTPKVEEHNKQHLLEKQLDLEAEGVDGDCYDDEYPLSDIGCGSISIEEG